LLSYWCLPKAAHILLSLFGFIKIAKKIQENKEKIVKVFARFLENVMYFCRPHPTSVVGANFCGCIFFDPCSEKNIKKIVKKTIKFDSYWCLLEKSGKNSGKRKFQAICLFCEFFQSSFVFTLLRYVSTRLSQHL
jgi:hypothetical protein